ncbi:hypothetical protein Acr_00g0036600 [Actinidia rufa]|uniref:Uncharacterized protein n=1 Tax=Actinidia rufa TaxID=165716 RepID=A0A7J0DGU4_9ERIC|nr:hypothetical protein Acr_00g0036600 [Actinidia rufa]
MQVILGKVPSGKVRRRNSRRSDDFLSGIRLAVHLHRQEPRVGREVHDDLLVPCGGAPAVDVRLRRPRDPGVGPHDGEGVFFSPASGVPAGDPPRRSPPSATTCASLPLAPQPPSPPPPPLPTPPRLRAVNLCLSPPPTISRTPPTPCAYCFRGAA